MHDLGCEVNQFGTDCLECGIRCNDCDVNNGCQKCSARFSGQHCQQCSPGYMGEDCGRNVYYKCFHICFDLFGGLHPTKEFYTHLETSFIWPRGSWMRLQYNVCILHITLRYHFLLFFNTLFLYFVTKCRFTWSGYRLKCVWCLWSFYWQLCVPCSTKTFYKMEFTCK